MAVKLAKFALMVTTAQMERLEHLARVNIAQKEHLLCQATAQITKIVSPTQTHALMESDGAAHHVSTVLKTRNVPLEVLNRMSKLVITPLYHTTVSSSAQVGGIARTQTLSKSATQAPTPPRVS